MMSKQSRISHAQSNGITLIELLIVIAIIAVLGGIGYPMYADYVAKARRADAQGALYALANAMEQHAARNPNTGYSNSTDADDKPLNSVFPHTTAPLDSNDSYYNLTVLITDAGGDGYGEAFTAYAAPTGKMTGDSCGTFELSNTGDRKPTTTGCWK